MRETIDQLVVRFKKKGPVVLLESQSDDHPAGTVSYLAATPQAVIKAYGNRVVVEENSSGLVTLAKNPWDALSDFRREYEDWMFGYLGYDLKNSLEDVCSLNRDALHAPDMYFMVPKVLVEFNHKTGSINVLKGNLPEIDKNTRIAEGPFVLGHLRSAVSKRKYISRIREAQNRIREGDFYEINLSHQMQAEYSGDSYDLYRKMKAVGPVPFGAYLIFGEWAICCQSPERFLNKTGRSVCSQPIKGTVQRGTSEEEDIRLKKILEASIKDRAENLMIVDLVRNDLGRIAEKGTVTVSDLFEIQTFGTVHQMVSTIHAISEADPIEIIKACYPMGSMTGAPKISALKAIEELECYRRGIYSGSIGYIEPSGDFDFNVVIRTALIQGDQLFYATGGAITGDSDPEAEWNETLVKTRALTKVTDNNPNPVQ